MLMIVPDYVHSEAQARADELASENPELNVDTDELRAIIVSHIMHGGMASDVDIKPWNEMKSEGQQPFLS